MVDRAEHKRGQYIRPEDRLDVSRLKRQYYENRPDPKDESQIVHFGTSGHRGTSFDSSFTESHILAITQAICELRSELGYSGPLFLGKDTHALSSPSEETALEVLAGNGIETRMASDVYEFTPTPVISHAIITANRNNPQALADGIVITSSHNAPHTGGIKYNPAHGGPADTDVTGSIAARANALLANDLKEVKRIPFAHAVQASCVQAYDYVHPYVDDLAQVLDMDAIAEANLKICADALGGAGYGYWTVIAVTYGLDIMVRNGVYDPTFMFMTYDYDGQIRMDCSSQYAMAGLINLKEKYDIAFGNDPDFDRHGIVTPSCGLLNPNHFLAVAIDYLFSHRPQWSPQAAVAKTLVSSSMIDRVAEKLKRPLKEVPVGFKWFVQGLLDGAYGFAGEESAGASFLRKDGQVWTTDKDGIILCLLAAEIKAVTGDDPGQYYQSLTQAFGEPVYRREEGKATLAQRKKLATLGAEDVTTETLGGDTITAKLTQAPGNNAPIGGLKVTTPHGWFAARPSGTEDIYKIYAESFRGPAHIEQIIEEAKAVVEQVM
ncbi:MAG: alpha-D-glucose phosphate-specific phosphoglucomutase [Phycisphaerales bacterium]|nr:MAG: alpha-D-glucose phosphate-specific phosphoglucomutase [Phycisphaerales bacterium]